VDIFWLESVESTQTFLIDSLKNNSLRAPVLVGATLQTSGRGSRGNCWVSEKGNLFISFALSRNNLPDDLKLESSSIYFAAILKETLEEMGSQLWLKWPNDFYLGSKKIGGVITNVVGDILVCGIGLNLCHAPLEFDILDIEIDARKLSEVYSLELEKFPTWKQIFSKFRLEFDKSRSYFTHTNNKAIELKNAILLEDGSLECNGQRMFSLR
jgi:BirA family biotin operon repressor/biotin-[acetyl-CoA-carboxylase] ligase